MRTLSRVSPPTLALVTAAEARDHCRVGHSDDDTYLAALVAAVTSHLDGPDGWLGRALAPQTLEVAAPSWREPAVMDLPCPPVASVASVTYVAADRQVRTLDPAHYVLVGATLAWRRDHPHPALDERADAVRVRYEAGWAAGALPASIKHAMLLWVSHLYENRSAVEAEALREIPLGAHALLSPHRRWWTP